LLNESLVLKLNSHLTILIIQTKCFIIKIFLDKQNNNKCMLYSFDNFNTEEY